MWNEEKYVTQHACDGMDTNQCWILKPNFMQYARNKFLHDV